MWTVEEELTIKRGAWEDQARDTARALRQMTGDSWQVTEVDSYYRADITRPDGMRLWLSPAKQKGRVSISVIAPHTIAADLGWCNPDDRDAYSHEITVAESRGPVAIAEGIVKRGLPTWERGLTALQRVHAERQAHQRNTDARYTQMCAVLGGYEPSEHEARHHKATVYLKEFIPGLTREQRYGGPRVEVTVNGLSSVDVSFHAENVGFIHDVLHYMIRHYTEQYDDQ